MALLRDAKLAGNLIFPCRLLELRERGLLHGECLFVALFLSVRGSVVAI